MAVLPTSPAVETATCAATGSGARQKASRIVKIRVMIATGRTDVGCAASLYPLRAASGTVAAAPQEQPMSDSTEATAPVVTIENGRATIRFNRARQHNRIEPDDLTVLRETFERIDADPAIRVSC